MQPTPPFPALDELPALAEHHQPDLRRYLAMLRRGKWVLLGCLLLIPAATYLISNSLTKTYQTASVLQIGTPQVDAALGASGSSQPQTAVTARLVQTPSIEKAAEARLGRAGGVPDSHLGAITAAPESVEGFLDLTANADSPRLAAATANAYAQAVVDVQREQAISQIDSSIAQLNAQRSSLPRADVTERGTLVEQILRLRTLRAGRPGNATLVQSAGVPATAISPRPVRNTELAVVVALLLGLSLVVLIDRLDRRLRESEELEELTGLPLLALISDDVFDSPLEDRAGREAFQTLRAGLRYFNIDRPLSTVLVASPLEREGKTTVATRLALALAREEQDVVLVDADMRRPQAGARLGVRRMPGLAEVLTGQRTVEECLVDAETEAGRLRVLPAGSSPPNPSELIASERMRTLLAELSGRSDMVIIDTTPVLAVSDVLPLLGQVSGVVLVSRLKQTTRDALRRARQIILTTGGTILGVVATGETERVGAYGYSSSYYTAAPPEEDRLTDAGEAPAEAAGSNGRQDVDPDKQPAGRV